MRTAAIALTLALFSVTPAVAQEKASGPKLPDGWTTRLDKANADASKFLFFIAGDGLHATTGPSGIVWRDEHANLKGNFRISATFLQTKAPAHPEAYGLIIGGKNLDKDNQEYGYFVIRGDGKYTVKHRAGTEVHTIQDWTDLPGLKKQDEAGKATNTVALEVSGGFLKAFVNGEEVKRWDEKNIFSTNGAAGLRVNHQLDLHISGFAVTPIK